MSVAITSISITDEDISTLSTVLNPIRLGNYLGPVLPSTWGILRAVELQVLRHRRGKRCTVEIMLQTTTGKRGLIGKVYATDHSDAYRAMDQIECAGFGPEEEFSIPRPLAYLASVHLLVSEKVDGPRAKDIFGTSSGQSCATATERCALWLAKFHTTELQSERRVSLRDQLSLLEQRAQRIADLGNPLADKARRLYNQLVAAASALKEDKARAGHGSYSPSHIILAEGRTVAIDWDRYNVADPARDVARFIIELRRLAYSRFGSIRALDAEADVFRETYLAASKLNVIVQLPFYEAITCLQIAGRIAQRQSGKVQKVETLLDEGLRTFEQRC